MAQGFLFHEKPPLRHSLLLWRTAAPVGSVYGAGCPAAGLCERTVCGGGLPGHWLRPEDESRTVAGGARFRHRIPVPDAGTGGFAVHGLRLPAYLPRRPPVRCCLAV